MSQDRLRKEACVILYPHGFLDVVLPDDLGRAVHVPLQTSNQLSAGLKWQETISSVRNLNADFYICFEYVQWKELSKCILVCQSSSKVVLDVRVHDGSEVVETAVPEQVNDEDLDTYNIEMSLLFPVLRGKINLIVVV